MANPEAALMLFAAYEYLNHGQEQLSDLWRMTSKRSLMDYPLRALDHLNARKNLDHELSVSEAQAAFLRTATDEPVLWANRYRTMKKLGPLLPLFNLTLATTRSIQDVLQTISTITQQVWSFSEKLTAKNRVIPPSTAGISSEGPAPSSGVGPSLVRIGLGLAIAGASWFTRQSVSKLATSLPNSFDGVVRNLLKGVEKSSQVLPYVLTAAFAGTAALVAARLGMKKLKNFRRQPVLKYEANASQTPRYLEVPSLSDLLEHPFEIVRLDDKPRDPNKPKITLLAPMAPLQKRIYPLCRPLGHKLLHLEVTRADGEVFKDYDVIYVANRDAFFVRTRKDSPPLLYQATVEPLPEHPVATTGETILGSPEALIKLAETWRDFGFYRLASEAIERASDRRQVTAQELVTLMAKHNTYPFGEESSLDSLPRDDIEPYEIFQKNGCADVVCNGGNGFGMASSNQMFKDSGSSLRAEARTVMPLQHNGTAMDSAHARTYYYTNKDELVDIVDFTPVRRHPTFSFWETFLSYWFPKKLPPPEIPKTNFLTRQESFDRWARANSNQIAPLQVDQALLRRLTDNKRGLDPNDPLLQLYNQVRSLIDTMSPEGARTSTRENADKFAILSGILDSIANHVARVEKLFEKRTADSLPASLAHYKNRKVGTNTVNPALELARSIAEVSRQLEDSLNACVSGLQALSQPSR